MASTWSAEVETKAPAAPLFKATFTDWHNLGPKLLPDIITGVTLLSGDGNPGSIRQINFSPGSTLTSPTSVQAQNGLKLTTSLNLFSAAFPFSSVKERLDFIDHDKLELKMSVVEGGDLGKKFESATSHIKVEPKGNGSVVKLSAAYKPVPGAADVEEDIKKAKEGFVNSVKAVEAYLAANPAAYA